MTATELGHWIDRHAGTLVLLARQWCGAAEDVVQEAFIKLMLQQPPPADPAAWLYRVVRNGAIDAARQQRRRRDREARVARPERWFAEQQVQGLDAAEAVRLLQALPAEQREAVIAHLWGGLSFEQIATVAGCSRSSAFRRYTQGVEALRLAMGESCPTND